MAKLNNIELVKQMIKDGWINVQKHPSADLYIMKYSKICALAHMWNEATLQCRGIIVDKDYNIVARPFSKFFNYEEIEDKSIIPSGSAKAYEKLDGSLGILYWINDVPYICTAGSFDSDQAKHATKILHNKYGDILCELERDRTFLFEIIYPENRLVVNYGDMDDIVLLGVLDIENEGKEYDIESYSNMFKTAKCYGTFDNWLEIREKFDGDNREGFVLKFENGFRLKMKYEDYFRLHRLRAYLTKKHIFEFVETNRLDELNEMLDQFDEETRISVNSVLESFSDRFNEIEEEAKAEYREFETDKEAAEYFKTCKWRPILFNMRKGKPYDFIILKQIKSEIKTESVEEDEE